MKAVTTAMIFMILVGAAVFNYFIDTTGFTNGLIECASPQGAVLFSNTAGSEGQATVVSPTPTTITASCRGILRSVCRLPQANVFSQTTNISPTSAASGIISIQRDSSTIKPSRKTAAVVSTADRKRGTRAE